MSFWTKPKSFGFELPRLSEQTTSMFAGTNCRRLSGAKVMQDLVAQCRSLAENRYQDHPRPHLAVILVGQNPASHVYVSNKRKRFAECGFETSLFAMDESQATMDSLAALIDQLNEDDRIHGILMQMPLPKGLDPQPLLDRISPHKDVDGFHVVNSGFLASGRYEGLLPCTPFGIFTLLRAYGIDVDGKSVTVVGRSNIVGKPAALMAINARASVSIVHKQTPDIRPFTRMADVLIVGAGSHLLIRKDHVRDGVVVVDVGIHKTPEGAIEGDVHPEVFAVAHGATPVPGGVGPMTIAMLCVNTAMACWSRGTVR
jgi:methylenetetrahydrofolate dehydrogenase (NADP+)/methenyltetrahydrofolate cyclohydrolase